MDLLLQILRSWEEWIEPIWWAWADKKNDSSFEHSWIMEKKISKVSSQLILINVKGIIIILSKKYTYIFKKGSI